MTSLTGVFTGAHFCVKFKFRILTQLLNHKLKCFSCGSDSQLFQMTSGHVTGGRSFNASYLMTMYSCDLRRHSNPVNKNTFSCLCVRVRSVEPITRELSLT